MDELFIVDNIDDHCVYRLLMRTHHYTFRCTLVAVTAR